MPNFSFKMHQIEFRLGLSPRPRWGSSQRFPRPPSWIWGRGREERGRGGKRIGRENGTWRRKRKGERGRERKRKGGDGNGKGMRGRRKGKGRGKCVVKISTYFRPCAIVSIALSCRLPFSNYLTFNNIVTLKSELRVTKVIEYGTIRKPGYDFLFLFYSNYGRIFSRCWDIQRQIMAKPG